MRGGTPRVVDFSTHFSGPIASQLLTQLGADVIKVENPKTGDGNRGMRPRRGDLAIAHLVMNSGTRSLAIDRRSSHWEEVVAACAKWADVAIVGNRPTAARARGLDFDTLTSSNSRLVYCAITAYGDNGPWADYPAHGLNPDALAGLVPIEEENGNPIPVPTYRSVGTPLSSVYAALGIMDALYRRDERNGPQYVSVSIWGAAMWWNWRDIAAQANTGQPWHQYRDLGSRYCLYYTGDGRHVLVCPTERKYWESFCDALGLPEEWRSHGSWERSGMDYGYEEERQGIAAAIKDRSLTQMVALLEKASIPFAPILTFVEAMTSEHAKSQEILKRTIVDNEEAFVPSSPVRVSDVGPGEIPSNAPSEPPPGLGQHTAQILEDIGLELAIAPSLVV